MNAPMSPVEKPTQADREAAAQYMDTVGWPFLCAVETRAGLADTPQGIHIAEGTLVQAFACRAREAVAADQAARTTTTEGDDASHYRRLLDDVPETWRKDGYKSEAEEIADMANVGRALMEALPEGYTYNDCPSEIVSDLQNERDDALAADQAARTTTTEGGVPVEQVRAFTAALLAEVHAVGGDMLKALHAAALAGVEAKHLPTPPATPAETVPCARCQGNGEIVTDWDRYRHPRPGDAGDEAVAACPNCEGTGDAPATPAGGGWIVANGAGDRWRCWSDFGSDWTDDREKATRYHRREDAEAVHAGDEDAWSVTPYRAALDLPAQATPSTPKDRP